jgi:chitosanase
MDAVHRTAFCPMFLVEKVTMSHLTILFALLAALLSSFMAKAPVEEERTQSRGSSAKKESEVLTSAQRRRADQIISVFENDTIELQYGYTEELDDGRGLTAGRAGFTTATGDLLVVVRRYVSRKPDSPLKNYLPRLKELAEASCASTDGLEGLSKDWEEAAHDPLFHKVQDEVVDELYYQHAVKWWKMLGTHTPLALLFLYDTVIQHGDGDDPDGLPAMIQRATERAGGTPKSGIKEETWLALFLDARREILAHAHDEATRAAWAEAVKRCDVLRGIAQEGNYDLHGPISIQPYRMKFTIE